MCRDLGKLIKKPVKDIVKRTCRRIQHQYYLAFQDQTYRFPKVGNVILPFEVSQQVAHDLGVDLDHKSTQPTYIVSSTQPKPPIISIVGHVNHGKSTLMDTLCRSNVTEHETEGITQTVNVAEVKINPKTTATLLDTPGHFHFHRMRNTASYISDACVLVVAVNEGVKEQTMESIGCIDQTKLPVIVVVNKMDLETDAFRFDQVVQSLREYISLESCPIFPIVATQMETLEPVKQALSEIITKRQATLNDYQSGAEGIALEVQKIRGQGSVIRVLGRNGTIRVGDHFICGLTHGIIRSLIGMDGNPMTQAMAGRVVDVSYSNKSSIKDAPIELEFQTMAADTARTMMQEKLLELEFEKAVLEEGDLEDEPSPSRAILIKADSAGALACLSDTIDEMNSVRVVNIGLGNISESDIRQAANDSCRIFGFNIKVSKREAKLAQQHNITIVILPTVHQLIQEIEIYGSSKPNVS